MTWIRGEGGEGGREEGQGKRRKHGRVTDKVAAGKEREREKQEIMSDQKLGSEESHAGLQSSHVPDGAATRPPHSPRDIFEKKMSRKKLVCASAVNICAKKT